MEAILFLLIGAAIGLFGTRLIGVAVGRFGPWPVLIAFSLLIVGFALWQGRAELGLLALIAPMSFGLLELLATQLERHKQKNEE